MSTYLHPVTGKPSFTAAWFLRPEQTYQLATSKFMENEVLKTNRLELYDGNDILGRCWVLFVKDYVKGKPRGADMKYVYPCESRYTIDGKSTSKIKLWQSKFPEPDLIAHAFPIVPVRVPMFKEDVSAASVATDHSKKRKTDDLADIEHFNFNGDQIQVDASHQDKKHKSTSHNSSSRHAATPIVTLSNSSRRDRSSSAMPSLSQQVASLALPGAEKGSTASSGNATPILEKASTAVAAPSVSSTDAAGALGPIFELFDRTPAEEIKWYAGVPLHVVERETVVHSLKYRIAKMKEKKAKTTEVANFSGVNGGNNSSEARDVKIMESNENSSREKQHDFESELWQPMKKIFYDLAAAYIS
ncbi:hypothetical protein HK100_006246 [Physocladia obscura]|uniref:BAH domain-containing protein n=1 Tax=Physocladia obscura TaxID=109957 RepID=A0AAD5SWB9_9FUNG|nr:hypothetical protein HK100_006246 [Physocladia obscura]